MKKDKAVAASAVHAHAGDDHVFALSALRVLLLEDTSGWFAQGLEIDYAACGESIELAQKNFEDGLLQTVHEHLQMHGSIERFLKPAGKEAWAEFYQPPASARRQMFSCVTCYSLADKAKVEAGSAAEALPFDHIAFLKVQNPHQTGHALSA